MATLFKRRTRGGKLGANWWATWRDHRGKVCTRSTGTSNEEAAKVLATNWETEDALSRHGHRDPVDRRPIEQHLMSYEAKLKAADNTADYVADTLRMIRLVCDDAGVSVAADIRVENVERFISKMMSKPRGGSARNRQKHLKAIRGFTRWLVATGRLPRDPLASLRGANPTKDRRHQRRMLLPEEWPHLAAATATGPVSYGMTGVDRLLLYRVAIETGLRAGELRDLTRSSVVFDAKRPYIIAQAGTTKSRKLARQYIRADLVADLRTYVRRKTTATPTAPLFILPDKWDMAAMLRADLAAARQSWLRERLADLDAYVACDQTDFLAKLNHAGETLDFHALRHTCGAWLVLSGVNVKVVQVVMRHSTIKLTLDTYGHLLPGQEADAVDGLGQFFSQPEVAPIAALKTGTDDAQADLLEGGRNRGRSTKRTKRASDAHASRTCDREQKDAEQQPKSKRRTDLRAVCASGACDLQMSPAGFEPTTYGLKGGWRIGLMSYAIVVAA
jgi:integrase